jgi:hypothetical protein
MENTLNAKSGKGYDLKQNEDGTIEISYQQQILDPAMTGFVVLPVLFFSTCMGIFGLGNTFAIPGGIPLLIFLIAAISIAGYIGVVFFNRQQSSIKITPRKEVEFGNHVLNVSDIQSVGLQAGSMGANRFKVFTLTKGEKIFITEFVSSATARAIQSGIQECLNKI